MRAMAAQTLGIATIGEFLMHSELSCAIKASQHYSITAMRSNDMDSKSLGLFYSDGKHISHEGQAKCYSFALMKCYMARLITTTVTVSAVDQVKTQG